MKPKGTVIYIIGCVVYAILCIISILLVVDFMDQANRAYSVQQSGYLAAAGIAITSLIGLTLWFISYTMRYIQGKSQIELLQELAARKNESDLH